MKYTWLLLSGLFTILTGFIVLNAELPRQSSTLFIGSGICADCHSAYGSVLTTPDGRDISPVTGWRSSMMANASRDPYWRAKVSAEVDAHPALQEYIEDKCLTCHAPMGRTEAIFGGSDHFSLAEALEDPLSLDGVSCALCHQVSGTNLGEYGSFSGNYIITDERNIYGPYEDVFPNPMMHHTDYFPQYGPQVKESALCGTCHTLFTPYLDDNMNIAGYFPEQTPFLEWLNSVYPGNEQTCQSCHMPAVNEQMKITLRPPWLTNEWTPVMEHEFAGGNYFMEKLLKQNAGDPGLNASADNLDATLLKTEAMLKRAVSLTASHAVEGKELVIDVRLENLAGHKFPTGFPSRRAWIHLVVMDHAGNIIFESGEFDRDGVITEQDERYERHHDQITRDSEVQIYEAVMGDVNNAPTFTLLRGATYLKDNRLLPAGYLSGAVADTVTGPSGEVLTDTDFNRDRSGKEGSGSDNIRYRIPISDPGAGFSYEAELLYQSISPDFVANLGRHDQPPVNTFLRLYRTADKTPLMIASLQIMVKN